MKVLIIAEAGVNHNGDITMARALVRAAAAAGADMVKFQSFVADKIATKHAPKAKYQTERSGAAETQAEMIARLELSYDDHVTLIEECKSAGIAFFSTGFDADSIDLLVRLNVDRIKVPSGEITNLPLLRHMASKRLPIILSTGMADMSDIASALAVFLEAGLTRDQITVLHCNTEYPTPMCDVNLRAMQSIANEFKVVVGYSDHTMGIEVPIAAVALGAKVIEKHLTLDRNLAGPDHAASLEPEEFTAMVSAIRNIEAALSGDGIKRPSESETKNMGIARKSIVAARDIAKGELFTVENLTTKRPGTGISPMKWDEVVGRKAPKAFSLDDLIEL